MSFPTLPTVSSVPAAPKRADSGKRALDEPLTSEFDIEYEGEIIVALSWRDPTSFWKAD